MDIHRELYGDLKKDIAELVETNREPGSPRQMSCCANYRALSAPRACRRNEGDDHNPCVTGASSAPGVGLEPTTNGLTDGYDAPGDEGESPETES